jgi:hypothetical protein
LVCACTEEEEEEEVGAELAIEPSGGVAPGRTVIEGGTGVVDRGAKISLETAPPVAEIDEENVAEVPVDEENALGRARAWGVGLVGAAAQDEDVKASAAGKEQLTAGEGVVGAARFVVKLFRH